MPEDHDVPHANEPDPPEEDGQNEEEDEAPQSAKTRAGSNVPNAAGNRGDGTHE